MAQTMVLAVKTYAELSGMQVTEVLTEMKNGNETVRNSVAMLMLAAA